MAQRRAPHNLEIFRLVLAGFVHQLSLMGKSTERRSTWRVLGRRWVWLGLVPGVSALNMGLPEVEALPTGIPEALGCSGAGPVSNVPSPPPLTWYELTPSNPLTGDLPAPLAVATDGFFVLTAITNGISAQEAQSQLQVLVTDAAGAELAGDVRLVAEEDWGRYVFGWSARAPLAIGDRLNAALSADPSASGAASVGGSFELLVVGEPVALPQPELVLTHWARLYQGTGEPLTCRSAHSCTSASITVPSNVLDRLAVDVTWSPPESSSPVAWRLTWQEGAESADAGERSWNYYGFGRKYEDHHLAVFPSGAGPHCVSLAIEDLRSGETSRAEACAEPGPLEDYLTNTRLRECSEPPSAGLTRAWCNLNGGRPAQCAGLPAQESEPGTEVVAASAGDASGCLLGGASTGQALSGVPALAALTLLGARRRRKRT